MKTLIFLSLLTALTLKIKAQDILIPTNVSVFSIENKELERSGSTLIFSGINVSLNTYNAVNIGSKKKRSNAGFGIISGMAQIANGVIYNEKETDLKTIDVSMGTATALFSAFCLMQSKKDNGKLSFSPSFLRAPFVGKITGFAVRLKF